MEKEDVFKFTLHSLERGLERLLQYEAPYSQKQLDMMKLFITKNMEWHPIKENWVLPDYGAELVIRNGSVVTLVLMNNQSAYTKPVTELQQKSFKKYRRLGSRRSNKKDWKGK